MGFTIQKNSRRRRFRRKKEPVVEQKKLFDLLNDDFEFSSDILQNIKPVVEEKVVEKVVEEKVVEEKNIIIN